MSITSMSCNNVFLRLLFYKASPKNGAKGFKVSVSLIFWGQTRTVSSITEALQPEGKEELIDVLTAHRRLNRGPKIVAIGGAPSAVVAVVEVQHGQQVTSLATFVVDGAKMIRRKGFVIDQLALARSVRPARQGRPAL